MRFLALVTVAWAVAAASTMYFARIKAEDSNDRELRYLLYELKSQTNGVTTGRRYADAIQECVERKDALWNQTFLFLALSSVVMGTLAVACLYVQWPDSRTPDEGKEPSK